jgi:hypothetical protein
MLRMVTSNVRDHHSVAPRAEWNPPRPADADQGRKACDALNEREFEGRRLTVNEARPQERKSSGYSGGGGRQRRDARW